MSILVDNELKTVTDANGEYTLKLRPYTYTVQPEHPHLFFPGLEVTVTPLLESLPGIQVEKMHLCGELVSSQS